jgi:hypothetical protein
VLYFVRGPHPSGTLPATPAVAPSAPLEGRPDHASLAREFIRWYELQFITRMRRVGSFSTDVQDLVNEMGLAKTLDRYVALREINLEYALQHPDCRNIPEDDLEKLAQRQFEHIMSSTRSSRRWIDYGNPKLRKGGIDPMKQTSLAWIPFYQKLLSAPAPDGGELKARIRAHVSRDEYTRAMERVTKAKAAWHAAMKEGIAWYASWMPWAKDMSDRVGKQDIAGCWATVDDIYGDAKGANKVIVAQGKTADTGTPATVDAPERPAQVGPTPSTP